ncbi:MAG: hypothetical protein WCV83_03640 [Candidatus Magasanikbacteria bacterium]|jgi:hypothetical protein
MFSYTKVYFKDRWVLVPALFLALFQLFMWVYAAMYVRATSDQIFLHYNVVFGVDLIGEWWKILVVPFGGLLIFLLNFSLSWYCYSTDKILARFLTFIAALLNLSLAVAFYLVVGLNI